MTFSCHICPAKFDRTEHLTRHVNKHLGLKPFFCELCQAHFSRRDSLRRHQLIHRDTSARHALSEGGRLRRGSVVRACQGCVTSKQRCDGATPCTRCASKGLTCSYPSRPKDRAANAKGAADKEQMAVPSAGSGRSPAAGGTPAVGQVHDAEGHATPDQDGHSPGTQDGVSPAVPVSTAPSEGFLSTTFDLGQLDMTRFDFGDTDERQPSPISHSTSLRQPFVPPSTIGDTVSTEYNPAKPQSLYNGDAVNGLSFRNKAKKSRTGPNYDILAPPCPHQIQLELPADLSIALKTYEDLGDAGTWMFEDYGHIPRLPLDVYEAIENWYDKVNCDGDLFQRFTDEPLPSLDVLNAFMQVYFEEFHPLFPLLHLPSLVPTKENWILVLALATIGCRFSQALSCRYLSKSLEELLRRAVVIAVERLQGSTPQLWLVQAALLSQVGTLYSEDPLHLQHAHTNRALLFTLCRRFGCFVPEPPRKDGVSTDWAGWVHTESRNRLAYGSWLLDSQVSMFWDLEPMIPTRYLVVSMPCHHALWDAPTAHAWEQQRKQPEIARARSWQEEIENVLDHKPLDDGIDEMSIFILTMSIYREPTRFPSFSSHLEHLRSEVKSGRGKRPLSPLALQHIYMTAISTYVPIGDLVAFSGFRVSVDQRNAVDERLRRWIETEPVEARDAVVQAARLFTSIRNNRGSSPHEGVSLLMASLMMCAYAELSPPADLTGRDILRLDRDDDPWRTTAWIMGDESMRPHLTRIGDLQCEDASTAIVREAAQVFQSRQSWPQHELIGMILTRAHQARRQSMSDGPCSPLTPSGIPGLLDSPSQSLQDTSPVITSDLDEPVSQYLAQHHDPRHPLSYFASVELGMGVWDGDA